MRVRRPIEHAPKPAPPPDLAPVQPAPLPDVDPPPVDVKPVRKIREIKVDGPPDLTPVVRASATLPIPTSVPADKVDAAIRRGVAWFREHPNEWVSGDHTLGRIALPALALLESGVEPNDPQIQRAADRVRELAADHTATYEISLAILFLDRLGDPADDALIQRLAARLIAGQTTTYGWTYDCRISRGQEMPLLKALDAMRPEVDLSMPLRREPGKGLIELEMPLAAGAVSSTEPAKRREPKMMLSLDVSADAEKLIRELPPGLRDIPVLDPETTRKPWREPPERRRRQLEHAVRDAGPLDRPSARRRRRALAAPRRSAIRADTAPGRRLGGSQPRSAIPGIDDLRRTARPGSRPRRAAPLRESGPARRGPRDSQGSRRPLRVDRRAWEDRDDNGRLNLYKLWSIERVGVLYRLPTIAGKDWYGWGAKRILREQKPNGSWSAGGYPGSTTMIDTSFALLFLRRSNLVQDLTDRLQLQMPIRETERNLGRAP